MAIKQRRVLFVDNKIKPCFAYRNVEINTALGEINTQIEKLHQHDKYNELVRQTLFKQLERDNNGF